MKKLLLLLILFLFITSGCSENNKKTLYESILKRDKIIVGISFDSKPFGFIDSNGEVKGMEADLAREIAKRILGNKNKVEFRNVTSQDRIKAAISGDVDMVISTMTITPQRKKLVDFSNSYFVAGQAICVRRTGKINSLYDLINKRIIVILGTTGEKNIRQFAPNALIQGYVNNSEAINAFKSGEDDAITTDDALLLGLVAESSEFILLPKKLTKEPYGIAFKKAKESYSLKESVNKIIKDIKEDGTLDSIKQRWISN